MSGMKGGQCRTLQVNASSIFLDNQGVAPQQQLHRVLVAAISLG